MCSYFAIFLIWVNETASQRPLYRLIKGGEILNEGIFKNSWGSGYERENLVVDLSFLQDAINANTIKLYRHKEAQMDVETKRISKKYDSAHTDSHSFRPEA